MKAETVDSNRPSRENTPLSVGGASAGGEGGSAKKRKAVEEWQAVEEVKAEAKDGEGEVKIKVEEETTDDPRRPKRVKSDVAVGVEAAEVGSAK